MKTIRMPFVRVMWASKSRPCKRMKPRANPGGEHTPKAASAAAYCTYSTTGEYQKKTKKTLEFQSIDTGEASGASVLYHTLPQTLAHNHRGRNPPGVFPVRAMCGLHRPPSRNSRLGGEPESCRSIYLLTRAKGYPISKPETGK